MVDVIKDIRPLLYQPGDLVPFRLNAGIVVASFFVSLIGAITTVELLQRRTNAKGWTAWYVKWIMKGKINRTNTPQVGTLLLLTFHGPGSDLVHALRR
jgi:hypothetical protein